MYLYSFLRTTTLINRNGYHTSPCCSIWGIYHMFIFYTLLRTVIPKLGFSPISDFSTATPWSLWVYNLKKCKLINSAGHPWNYGKNVIKICLTIDFYEDFSLIKLFKIFINYSIFIFFKYICITRWSVLIFQTNFMYFLYF